MELNQKSGTYAFIPIFWFLGFWILDLLCWQKVPVIFQITRFHLFVVNQHFVAVVRANDQCVEMCEHIVFASDFFVDQMIFALVAEDNVHFFGAWSANVWTKHNQVW